MSTWIADERQRKLMGDRGRPDYIVEADSGCWLWQKTKSSLGYGSKTVRGRVVLAHRHYYEMHYGPIPAGLPLDHLCRNPSCVNPNHLEPVTQAENVRRSRRAKLAPAAVREIRRLSAAGCTQRNIAAQFGICSAQACNIINRRRWSDVK